MEKGTNLSLTAVTGLRVGHWTDKEALTGCTVVLCDEGAVAAVDVRGGGPGTRETDALAPGRLVEKIDGIVLTGGSAFGLGAADGVMAYLEEQGKGFDTGFARVPIVPAAVIYDLGIGNATVRPRREEGYGAAAAATADPVAQGNVGAGTGATAGKWAGPNFAMKSGLGSAAMPMPGGGTVGALVVANPVGDIVESGQADVVAGAYNKDAKQFVRSVMEEMSGDGSATSGAPFNTVIAVVATDIPLSKGGVQRMATMAHDGLARTVYPSHTPFDGDTIFALSTGLAPDLSPAGSWAEETERVALVGAAAADVLARAVVAAAKAAVGAGGLPAWRDVVAGGE